MNQRDGTLRKFKHCKTKGSKSMLQKYHIEDGIFRRSFHTIIQLNRMELRVRYCFDIKMIILELIFN